MTMTVGELRARLAEFDDSLPVRVNDNAQWSPNLSSDTPLLHANLPEHEQYVVLSTSQYERER